MDRGDSATTTDLIHGRNAEREAAEMNTLVGGGGGSTVAEKHTKELWTHI